MDLGEPALGSFRRDTIITLNFEMRYSFFGIQEHRKGERTIAGDSGDCFGKMESSPSEFDILK